METTKFKTLIEEKLKTVIERVEREVPESGDFMPVYEDIPESDENHIIYLYRIMVMKMPTVDVPDETKRFVKIITYIKYCDYKASTLVAGGNKAKILDSLKQENYVELLFKTFEGLIDSSRDV